MQSHLGQTRWSLLGLVGCGRRDSQITTLNLAPTVSTKRHSIKHKTNSLRQKDKVALNLYDPTLISFHYLNLSCSKLRPSNLLSLPLLYSHFIFSTLKLSRQIALILSIQKHNESYYYWSITKRLHFGAFTNNIIHIKQMWTSSNFSTKFSWRHLQFIYVWMELYTSASAEDLISWIVSDYITVIFLIF